MLNDNVVANSTVSKADKFRAKIRELCELEKSYVFVKFEEYEDCTEERKLKAIQHFFNDSTNPIHHIVKSYLELISTRQLEELLEGFIDKRLDFEGIIFNLQTIMEKS